MVLAEIALYVNRRVRINRFLQPKTRGGKDIMAVAWKEGVAAKVVVPIQLVGIHRVSRDIPGKGKRESDEKTVPVIVKIGAARIAPDVEPAQADGCARPRPSQSKVERNRLGVIALIQVRVARWRSVWITAVQVVIDQVRCGNGVDLPPRCTFQGELIAK